MKRKIMLVMALACFLIGCILSSCSFAEAASYEGSKAEARSSSAKNGLYQDKDGSWRLYKNGRVRSDYTGIVYYKPAQDWFYVEKGSINWSYYGIAYCDAVDDWFYIAGGRIDWSYTGLVYYPVNGGWFYVEYGRINWNYNGIVLYENSWYNIDHGWLNWNYTGISWCEAVQDWFYIEGGMIRWDFTDLAYCPAADGWFYVENARIDWTRSGLYYYEANGGWYYLVNGRVDWNYNGIVPYGNDWYNVDHGWLNWNYTGVSRCEAADGWFYVENAMINWNYSGEYMNKPDRTLYNVDHGRAEPIAVLPEDGYYGALHVEGTKLKDAQGQTVQLKGLSTHGLAWFPQYINDSFVKQLKETFGINVLRLAMYTAEYNGYCSGGNQTELKNLVKKGVQCAVDQDMYVIIDWHILSDNNPNTHVSEAKQFFAEMSSLYKDCPNVLYEICNEPNGSTSWQDVKNYARQVIPVIRENSPDAVILVGTPVWSQRADQAAASPLSEYDNIMYSLHFYAATHKEDLRNTMVQAVKKGLPVFVTEFGICDASGNGSIDKAQADQWIRLLDQYDISYIMWNISNKNETSSILKPDCSKSQSFAESDLSDSGLWFLEMMRNGGAVTGNTQPGGSQSEEPQGENEEQEEVFTQENLAVSKKQTNSWSSAEGTCYQYEITVTNQGSGSCSSWKVELPMGRSFTISQGWGGHMSVSGDTLIITSMDYNGTLAPGESINNIGVIITEK